MILLLNSYWMADSITKEQFSVSGKISKGDSVRNGKKGEKFMNCCELCLSLLAFMFDN